MYVAVHGLQRIEHGYRPALPFEGCTNPEIAFRLAVFGWILGEAAAPNGFSTKLRTRGNFVYEVEPEMTFAEPYLLLNAIGDVFMDATSEHRIRQVPHLEITDQQVDADFGFTCVQADAIMLQAQLEGVTVRMDYRTSPLMSIGQWRRIKLGLVEAGMVEPMVSLTKEQADEVRELEAERARQQKEEQERAREALWDRQRAFQRKLEILPELALSSPKAWTVINTIIKRAKRNTLHFAEGWARLIQEGMANGKRLEDCALSAQQEAAAVYPVSAAQVKEAIRLLQTATWLYAPNLSIYWKEYRKAATPSTE